MNPLSTKFILAERFTFVPNSNSLIDQENEDEIIRLGTNESRILLMLAQHPNEVIQRDELHDFVWRKQGFEVDDSSLTQAISTLRKMLKDSTKSPNYIKTVPKRGYQLIANVEPIPEVKSSTSETYLNDQEDPLALQQGHDSENTSGISGLSASANQNDIAMHHHEVYQQAQSTQQKSSMTLSVKVMLFIAFILPIITVLYHGQKDATFRQLDVIDGITINTPNNHPDISIWLPVIEACVKKHQQLHPQEVAPSRIIATGGQGTRLVLNYIYPIDYSDENITLNIGTNQEDTAQICQ